MLLKSFPSLIYSSVLLPLHLNNNDWFSSDLLRPFKLDISADILAKAVKWVDKIAG